MSFNKKIKMIIAVIFGLLALFLYGSAYIVTEKDQVVVFQFGNPVKESKEPGLYFKLPFIQNIEYQYFIESRQNEKKKINK